MWCCFFRCSFPVEMLHLYTHILKSIKLYGNSKELLLVIRITEDVSVKSCVSLTQQ